MAAQNTAHLADLGFIRYRPSVALSNWIDWFWYIKSESAHHFAPQFMHPEGGSGLIFNFADPLSFNSNEHSLGAIINGPAVKTTQFKVNGQVEALGVRFKPGAISALIDLPAAEISNQSLALNECHANSNMRYWAEQLAEIEQISEKINWLEKALMPLFLTQQKNIARLAPAIELMCKQNGQLDSLDLIESMNLSQRQFERLCIQQLGMTAKKFCRIQRTIKARELLRNSSNSMTIADLACELGFYDQAHFTHEFKQVIGITPGQFRNKIFAG